MATSTTTRKRAPAKKAAAPRGAARIPKRSQGWYRDPDTGEKLRSVTTILGQGVPKEELVFWAGNLTAQSAIDNLPALVAASRIPAKRAEMYDWLRRAHTRKKDERADVGSAVHKIVEALLLELPLPDELLDDDAMAPFLENFLAFVRDFEVTFEASEMVVANPGRGYAGTLDFLARSPELFANALLMGDTKTGGEMCTGDALCVRIRPYQFKKCSGELHTIKGVYPEAGLQMSAYSHAEVCWLRDGQKVPMPVVHDVGIVLHLRPEGYLVHPARCGEDLFEVFADGARRVAEFTSQTSKSVLGDPFPMPAKARGAA